MKSVFGVKVISQSEPNAENSSKLSASARIETESTPMPEFDAMGREKFWEDLGRPDGQ